MKKRQLLFCAVFSMAVLALPAIAWANLLKNPDFEEGRYTDDQSLPSYWESERSGGESWHSWKNDGLQHNGTKYIAVGGMDSGAWGYYKQNVPGIIPNQVYVVNAWVVAEPWQPPSSPAAYLRVEFKDNKGTILRTDKLAVLTGQNTVWSRKTLITKPAPLGVTNADVMCYGQGRGTAMFDEVSFELQSK